MKQSQCTTPIPIVCLDPIEHTGKSPYCLDSTCPCMPTFEVIKAWFLGKSPDDASREVYAIHALPGLGKPVWLLHEWYRATAPGLSSLSVVHPITIEDGQLHLIHWEDINPLEVEVQ